MNEKVNDTRECPLCREEIKVGAVRCKHCKGEVTPEAPQHGGVCPFCKEEIHPDAIRCKHCHASLAPASACGCSDTRRLLLRPQRRRLTRSQAGLAGKVAATPAVTVGPDAGTLFPRCAICPAWVEEADGWFGILVDCDDKSCTYEAY